MEIDPSEDSRACRHCTYYIAVYGSSEATYSLSVSVENTWHNLQDGIPSSGRVGFLDWNYYVYYNSFGSARDFHLTLNSMNGNADVYITLGEILTNSYFFTANLTSPVWIFRWKYTKLLELCLPQCQLFYIGQN